MGKYTLQHVAYSNVFALGDVAGTPNAKTGAAASRQALVVVSNLVAVLKGQEPTVRYNGYIACPVVTGYGRMLLCELDYTSRPAPTIPVINTFRERYDMWLLKKYVLSWLYWNIFAAWTDRALSVAQVIICRSFRPHIIQRRCGLSSVTGFPWNIGTHPWQARYRRLLATPLTICRR